MKFKFTITGLYETDELNYPKGLTKEQIIKLDKEAMKDEPELLFEMAGNKINIEIESYE